MGIGRKLMNDNLIDKIVENFRNEYLFCQSNNEFFMRHIYLLIKH